MKMLLIISIFFSAPLIAQHKYVVAQKGKADFRTIQEAINQLPDHSMDTYLIEVKNGIYNEKLLIEKDNLVIKGESRDGVIITQAIARDEFRCTHPDDWGVATVNVNGNDVLLENLTIKNSFGFDLKEEKTIPCANDSLKHEKKISRSGHQMALRTMKATRFSAINCSFISFGGDTASPWNVEGGIFYFKDCSFEGGVDLYCPRGYAFADHCRFYAWGGQAIIWHDGSKKKETISVMKDCYFDGYEGFYLGRYHRESQMFLLDCKFSNNMKDSAVYHAASGPEIQWGERIYYKNCHGDKQDYSWFADNVPNEIFARYHNLEQFLITTNWLKPKQLTEPLKVQ